jgi:hypothetical protein
MNPSVISAFNRDLTYWIREKKTDGLLRLGERYEHLIALLKLFNF